MTLTLTKEATSPGFTSYKTDIDHQRAVAWALITSGYKRTITLTWYHSAERRTVQEENFKTVKAAKDRLSAVEHDLAKAAVPAGTQDAANV